MPTKQQYLQQMHQNMGQILLRWAMQKEGQEQKKEEAKLALEKRKQDMDFFKEKLKLQTSAQKETAKYRDELEDQNKYEDRLYELLNKPKLPDIGAEKKTKGGTLVHTGKNNWRYVPDNPSPTKKENPYTKQQLVDDTRGFYKILMDSMKDPNLGYVRPDKMDEYKQVESRMKEDMFAIGNGLMPSWLKKTEKGKTIANKVKKQTGKTPKIAMPTNELPKNINPRKVSMALKNSPPGYYNVDGVEFKWNGRVAVPYYKIGQDYKIEN